MHEWDRALKKLQDKGHLVLGSYTRTSALSSKIKTICDLIGIIPECFQKAFTVDSIRGSFAKAGYIGIRVDGI